MNESGLCECGCGGVTARTLHDDPKRGMKAGDHNRFIHGHYHIMRRAQKPAGWKSSYEVLCERGWCGNKTPAVTLAQIDAKFALYKAQRLARLAEQQRTQELYNQRRWEEGFAIRQARRDARAKKRLARMEWKRLRKEDGEHRRALRREKVDAARMERHADPEYILTGGYMRSLDADIGNPHSEQSFRLLDLIDSGTASPLNILIAREDND